MNSKFDVTIGGEPFLAFQLWANLRSGKIIKRIWGQTVSCGKVVSLSSFEETCETHFKGRPCLGSQVDLDHHTGQDFVISQNPVPRKISRKCQNFLDPRLDAEIKSCLECAKLNEDFAIEELVTTDACVNENAFRVQEKQIAPTQKIEGKALKGESLACPLAQQSPSMEPIKDATGHRDMATPLETFLVDGHEETTPLAGPDNRIVADILKKNPSKLTASKPVKIKYMVRNSEGLFVERNITAKPTQQQASDIGPSGSVNIIAKVDDTQVTSSPPQKVAVSTEEGIDDISAVLFTCDICGVTFTNPANLSVRKVREVAERHKSKHGVNPLQKKCEVCGKAVYSWQVKNHMNSHGLQGTFYMECKWCNESFSTNGLLQHVRRIHYYGTFLCEMCMFTGYSVEDFIDHIDLAHQDYQVAQCPECKSDIAIQELENHYKICMGDRIKELSRTKKAGKCSTCGKHFENINQHLKTHLRKQADNSQCDTLYRYCDQCGMKFSKSSALRHHIQSVHDKISYKCSLCPMTFKTNHERLDHNHIIHSTDLKYQCKYCGIRKRSTAAIQNHERIHEDPKFPCSFCGKKLKTPKLVEIHERIHTGEKPFRCSVCDGAYVSKNALQQHERGVHKIVGPMGGKPGWSRKSKRV